MADAPEIVGGPPAVDQTGNLTVWAIPGETVGIDLDHITKVNLDATSAKRITYSFTPGGYDLTLPQEKLDDQRLTAPQRRQSLGQVNPEMPDLKYVDSIAAGSAAVLFKDGGSWIFVERRNVPQTQVAATPQVVRAIKVSLGVQAPGPLDGSGKFTKTNTVVVEYVSPEHALVAGA